MFVKCNFLDSGSDSGDFIRSTDETCSILEKI